MSQVLSSRAAATMAERTEFVIGPGDFFSIPGGPRQLDSGKAGYVSLRLFGAGQYPHSAGGAGSQD